VADRRHEVHEGQAAPGASAKTLRQEVDEWLAGAQEGRILNKREQPYKPAVLRNYELSLRLRVLPELATRNSPTSTSQTCSS
jgi:hypothetical protein